MPQSKERVRFWRKLRIVLGLEENVEAEIGVEHECAAVIGVVAHEEVGHGSLRRRGFQRGMRVDDAGGSVEAGIGNSPDSGVAVVVGHVLEQPVDGVVEVGAVVDVLFRLLVVDVGTHLDECSFGHVAAADILIDEDVSGFVEVGRRAELGAIEIDAVRADAVGRAVDQERVGMRSVLGHIDGGEQMDAVAHGDAVFVFRVVFFDVELRSVGAVLGPKGTA